MLKFRSLEEGCHLKELKFRFLRTGCSLVGAAVSRESVARLVLPMLEKPEIDSTGRDFY